MTITEIIAAVANWEENNPNCSIQNLNFQSSINRDDLDHASFEATARLHYEKSGSTYRKTIRVEAQSVSDCLSALAARAGEIVETLDTIGSNNIANLP